MALEFDPGAAEVQTGSGQAVFVLGLIFDAPGAAEVLVSAGPATFLEELIFDAPGAAEVSVRSPGVTFEFETVFEPDGAEVIVESAEAEFFLEETEQVFEPGGAEVVYQAGQAEFTLGVPASLEFDVPGAAEVIVEAGLAEFIGGISLSPPPPFFPYDPDMTDPIVERYGYPTGLTRSDRGYEQRQQLRSTPLQSISFKLKLLEPGEAQAAAAFLHSRQGLPISLALWFAQNPLAAPAAADQNIVMVDTVSLPFRAGGLAVIWRSPWSWELVRVAAVEPDRLITVEPLGSAWPVAGTWGSPVEVGRVPDDPTIDWLNLLKAGSDLTFELEREYLL